MRLQCMLPLSSLHADTRTLMPMPKPVTVGFTYGQESALTVYQAKKNTQTLYAF